MGRAIDLAASSFSPQEETRKVIVVISDGENHEDNPVEAAKKAAERGIVVHAIGIGSQQGAPIPDRGRLVGCGCTFKNLAVRADGAFVPCVMLPQLVLGRIGQETLEDVWQKAPVLQQMRNRTQVKLDQFAECRDCAWRDSCTGNCPGTAYTITGQVDHPCPLTCLKRFQQELEERGLTLWP